MSTPICLKRQRKRTVEVVQFLVADARLLVRRGLAGTPGRVEVRTCQDPEDAQQEGQKLWRSLLSSGFAEGAAPASWQTPLERPTGKITWFDGKRGPGWIQTDDSRRVHFTPEAVATLPELRIGLDVRVEGFAPYTGADADRLHRNCFEAGRVLAHDPASEPPPPDDGYLTEEEMLGSEDLADETGWPALGDHRCQTLSDGQPLRLLQRLRRRSSKRQWPELPLPTLHPFLQRWRREIVGSVAPAIELEVAREATSLSRYGGVHAHVPGGSWPPCSGCGAPFDLVAQLALAELAPLFRERGFVTYWACHTCHDWFDPEHPQGLLVQWHGEGVVTRKPSGENEVLRHPPGLASTGAGFHFRRVHRFPPTALLMEAGFDLELLETSPEDAEGSSAAEAYRELSREETDRGFAGGYPCFLQEGEAPLHRCGKRMKLFAQVYAEGKQLYGFFCDEHASCGGLQALRFLADTT